MPRATSLSLLAVVGVLNACAQTPSMSDIQGSWYFHQYYIDADLFADADVPTPPPQLDIENLKAVAAANGQEVPDSAFAAIAAGFKQIDESYRQYRLDIWADSTYVTELAARMTKLLPENGRVLSTTPEGTLQLLDALGSVAVTSIVIKDGELHLSLIDPSIVLGWGDPTDRLLIFRRKQP